MGKCGCFFSARQLSFQTASRIIQTFWSSGKLLAFQPRGSWVRTRAYALIFFYKIFEADSHFFRQYETPLPLFGFLRLIFENFLMSPKGPPFIFLIFCNRMNVKEFKRVSSFRFFGTMRLLKIRIFFENFSKSPNGPPSIFFEISQKNGC